VHEAYILVVVPIRDVKITPAGTAAGCKWTIEDIKDQAEEVALAGDGEPLDNQLAHKGIPWANGCS
jgi:hypothetical protein